MTSAPRDGRTAEETATSDPGKQESSRAGHKGASRPQCPAQSTEASKGPGTCSPRSHWKEEGCARREMLKMLRRREGNGI